MKTFCPVAAGKAGPRNQLIGVTVCVSFPTPLEDSLNVTLASEDNWF